MESDTETTSVENEVRSCQGKPEIVETVSQMFTCSGVARDEVEDEFRETQKTDFRIYAVNSRVIKKVMQTVSEDEVQNLAKQALPLLSQILENNTNDPSEMKRVMRVLVIFLLLLSWEKSNAEIIEDLSLQLRLRVYELMASVNILLPLEQFPGHEPNPNLVCLYLEVSLKHLVMYSFQPDDYYRVAERIKTDMAFCLTQKLQKDDWLARALCEDKLTDEQRFNLFASLRFILSALGTAYKANQMALSEQHRVRVSPEIFEVQNEDIKLAIFGSKFPQIQNLVKKARSPLPLETPLNFIWLYPKKQEDRQTFEFLQNYFRGCLIEEINLKDLGDDGQRESLLSMTPDKFSELIQSEQIFEVNRIDKEFLKESIGTLSPRFSSFAIQQPTTLSLADSKELGVLFGFAFKQAVFDVITDHFVLCSLSLYGQSENQNIQALGEAFIRVLGEDLHRMIRSQQLNLVELFTHYGQVKPTIEKSRSLVSTTSEPLSTQKDWQKKVTKLKMSFVKFLMCYDE